MQIITIPIPELLLVIALLLTGLVMLLGVLHPVAPILLKPLLILIALAVFLIAYALLTFQPQISAWETLT
jgi:hypothetical protein